MPCPEAAQERRLVADAKAGDAVALERLYEQYRACIYDFAFTLTGNHEDAEDARQMTFVRAFLGLSRFRGDSALRTWLLRICLNVVRSSRRRSSKNPPCAPEHPLDLARGGERVEPPLDPAGEAQRRLEAEEIRRRIASLPRWAAALVALCDLQGLSYREAAQVLGCSATSVGPRLHRARKMLKKRLVDLV